MQTKYTVEKNTLILISLMKAHGIRKIVTSPGATNVSFVMSVQCDPYFQIYSSVDERSAAYIACGLAAESGEAVALSCTGATASRNYMSGLTEAYYRKLPILVITSSQSSSKIGHYFPQVTDRSSPPSDTVKLSYQLSVVHDINDWGAIVGVNNALLELWHDGCGPVHINLETTYSNDFNVDTLPQIRKIERFYCSSKLPLLSEGKIGIFVGAHEEFTKELSSAVDAFCSCHNAVVICDQTSNYRGKYRVLASLLANQSKESTVKHFDILVHIGTISGGYIGISANEVWRVNPDGVLRDTFHTLHYVFEMSELEFFRAYTSEKKSDDSLLKQCREDEARIRAKIPQLPFSNIWIASQTAGKLPENSVLHLGILNSLRSWNFFETPESVRVYCNTGGFGIDGCLSTLLGASLANANKLYFGVMGDLAFFYDMNALGNRYLGSNVRLMIINNGVGTEFKNYNHRAAAFGDDADAFVAARGHFGNQSRKLIKDYAEDLGCRYISASNKEEYLAVVDEWLSPEKQDKPIVFEVFTLDRDESNALKLMNTIERSMKGCGKKIVRKVLGQKGVKYLKKLLGR